MIVEALFVVIVCSICVYMACESICMPCESICVHRAGESICMHRAGESICMHRACEKEKKEDVSICCKLTAI